MSKLKKIVSILLLAVIISLSGKVFATELIDYAKDVEISKEYKEWLELSDEEKQEVLEPRMFEIRKTFAKSNNPLNVGASVGASTLSKYNLKDYISNNIVIRNQKETNSCWAFAALGSLETNLALKDYYNGNTAKVYDFSERHMEYATSRTFNNGQVNTLGFNREVGSGGNSYISYAYLTNGTGAVQEGSMPFENNEDMIDISEIKDKEVVTQVYDTVNFPAYDVKKDDLTDIKERMKAHIKNYGGIESGIYGASLFSDYCNNETGAVYCDDKNKCKANHDVVIIGWDDNYSTENFVEEHRPQNNGAWIIKNSWGEKIEYTLEEMKEYILKNLKDICNQYSWNTPAEIPDDVAKSLFEKIGFEIDGDTAKLNVGDNGIMYVSYEDVNIYGYLTAVQNASNKVNYDNIYQYNYFGTDIVVPLRVNKAYISNVFEKQTDKKEYLTEVSIYAPETYTCKVYINPNGESKDLKNLQKVVLKEGESETFDAGYHTIEFLNPVEINSNKFAVVVEIQGTREDGLDIAAEANYKNTVYDGIVNVKENACFWTVPNSFENNVWVDFSKQEELSDGGIPNSNSTIKAFTTVSASNPSDDNNEDNDNNNDDDDNNQSNNDNDNKGENNNEEKAKNSVFSDVKCNVKNVRVYYFNNKDKKDYMTMDVTLDNVNINNTNDSLEHYYFLATSSLYKTIRNWVKIEKLQISNNKLEFTINTNDISNFGEIKANGDLYLYIKEVAKKGNSTSELIAKAIPVESTQAIEVYIDGVKQTSNNEDNNNSGDNKTNNNINKNNNSGTSSKSENDTKNSDTNKVDDTKANKNLPHTGTGTIIIAVFIITVAGITIYFKYNDMKF